MLLCSPIGSSPVGHVSRSFARRYAAVARGQILVRQDTVVARRSAHAHGRFTAGATHCARGTRHSSNTHDGLAELPPVANVGQAFQLTRLRRFAAASCWAQAPVPRNALLPRRRLPYAPFPASTRARADLIRAPHLS